VVKKFNNLILLNISIRRMKKFISAGSVKMQIKDFEITDINSYRCIRCNSSVLEFEAYFSNDISMKCICSKCLSHNRIVSLKELDKINGE
jgi:hypothetical protein